MTTQNDTTTPVPDDDENSGETTQPEDSETEQPDQLGADGTDESGETTSPNREAAKWRTRFRAAESERDQLAERLSGYQRREVESAVADVLAQPGDLWDVGRAELSSFYDEDGELDAAAVRAAAEALVADRPGLAFGATLPDTRKRWGQYSATPPGEGPNWRDVLR